MGVWLLQLLYCTWDLMILPFIYLGAVYTGEEWRSIVNSITAREDVSAQGAPRESRAERLSPKPPRSTANSSVIADQTRPQPDQPCTDSGHWGYAQAQPLLPSSLYPYQYPYSLCCSHSITYSKVWLWLCLSKFCHTAEIVYESEGHGGLLCHTVWSL